MKVYLLHCTEKYGDFCWISGVYKNKKDAEEEITRRMVEDNQNEEEDTYYNVREMELNEK